MIGFIVCFLAAWTCALLSSIVWFVVSQMNDFRMIWSFGKMPSSVVCLSLISSVVNSPVCLFDHLLLSILTDLPYLVFACERFQLLVFILIQGFCIKGVMKKLLVGPYLVIILLEFSHFLFTLIFFFLKFIFFKKMRSTIFWKKWHKTSSFKLVS